MNGIAFAGFLFIFVQLGFLLIWFLPEKTLSLIPISSISFGRKDTSKPPDKIETYSAKVAVEHVQHLNAEYTKDSSIDKIIRNSAPATDTIKTPTSDLQSINLAKNLTTQSIGLRADLCSSSDFVFARQRENFYEYTFNRTLQDNCAFEHKKETDVLSPPAATSAPPQVYVAISVWLAKRRSYHNAFLLPLTAMAWKTLLNITTIAILMGKGWTTERKLSVSRRYLRRLGAVIVDVPNAGSVSESQSLRLYSACLPQLSESSFIIMADADLFPVRPMWDFKHFTQNHLIITMDGITETFRPRNGGKHPSDISTILDLFPQLLVEGSVGSSVLQQSGKNSSIIPVHQLASQNRTTVMITFRSHPFAIGVKFAHYCMSYTGMSVARWREVMQLKNCHSPQDMTNLMRLNLWAMYGRNASWNRLAPMHPDGADWCSDEILISTRIQATHAFGRPFDVIHLRVPENKVQRVWMRGPFGNSSAVSASCSAMVNALDVHMHRATGMDPGVNVTLNCLFRNHPAQLRWCNEYIRTWERTN